MNAEYSFTEENYLKAIFKLSEHDDVVSTNAIAEELNTKPPSVSDMVKKLEQKELVSYQKYKGVQLSNLGKSIAIRVIRKHRLWEVFLVEKLAFNWDEVHELAEQLEHIISPKLVDRLDKFLDYPKFDPHGDPIPSKEGVFPTQKTRKLSILKNGEQATVVGVTQDQSSFLQYLTHIGLQLGDQVTLMNHFEFDQSMDIQINAEKKVHISAEIADNNLVD